MLSYYKEIKTNRTQDSIEQMLHMQWEEAEHNVHEHTQKWNEVVLTTEAIFPFICVFRQSWPQWFHCTWSFRELIPTFFSRQEVNSMKLKQQMPNMRKGEGRHQFFETSHRNQHTDANSGRLPCRKGSITASVGFDDTWHKATVCSSLKTTIYLAHFSDRVKQWIL